MQGVCMNTNKYAGVSYLNPRYLGRAVRRFGYQFSPWKYAGCFVGLGVAVTVVSFSFRLKFPCVLVIACAAACFVPGLFAMTYRNLYEAKRFEDLTAYMEQLLYSFKRRAKILNALEDVLTLFEEGESKLYDAVVYAVRYIQSAEAKDNIYREAFEPIEKEYGCSRLYKIHDFLIEAEAVGGDFTAAADMLLEDRKRWIDRVYELQKEKRNIKTKVTIGIGLSFLIGAMTVFMMPKEFHVTDTMVSQTVTVFMIILNMLIWYVAWTKLSKGLIHQEEGNAYLVSQKRYDYVMHKDQNKERRKACLLALLILPLVCLFVWEGQLFGAAAAIGFSALLGTQPKRKHRISRRYVIREIEKVFPQWLMSMALHLQTDNIHVSLAKSIPQAPEILREELTELSKRIEEKPDSVRPYLLFMSPLLIPDVTSAMKVLYSMSEFGAGDAERQIGPLAERGIIMTDKAERLKGEDYIAGVGFLVLLPMLTGVMKMLTDLALVMVYILSAVNTVG